MLGRRESGKTEEANTPCS